MRRPGKDRDAPRWTLAGAAPMEVRAAPLAHSLTGLHLLPYWILLAYFAGGALLSDDARRGESRISTALLIGGIIIALMVGLRYEVGADWPTYKILFSYAAYADLGRMLSIGDPAYQLLSWTVRRIGVEIWLVNLVCGTIFAWGLLRFASVQPNPWLAVLVAVPYLVTVVAMGYTRQATAIGILLAGLAAVHRGATTFRFEARHQDAD